MPLQIRYYCYYAAVITICMLSSRKEHRRPDVACALAGETRIKR